VTRNIDAIEGRKPDLLKDRDRHALVAGDILTVDGVSKWTGLKCPFHRDNQAAVRAVTFLEDRIVKRLRRRFCNPNSAAVSARLVDGHSSRN
jgi:hypothetical protein